ncbi:Extradiol ring-cleavage dioxygenase, class III enzyme, subunit B [Dipodascopsis tothii]|uniref:Extradiol ring-cleavage dioxygenase, class III enzyme, subunit B n=1 Tax=Dipodascopsis tothii TaxID=44089 RepID=UPI0034CDE05E
MSKAPVYFFSHGGPTFMYQSDEDPTTDSGAFRALRKIGKEIVEEIKPSAVIVLSAHWQTGRESVEVNAGELTELIYDFYGFPDHMYREKYPSVGSRELASKVVEVLGASGIKALPTKRGLDHGVWVPFKVAFPPGQELKVPVVQLSLFGNESPERHIALGRALAPLRDENVVIIGSGMTVHNLRDMFQTLGRKVPYAKRFDDALAAAVTTSTGEEREAAMIKLFGTSDIHHAHPTKEHL